MWRFVTLLCLYKSKSTLYVSITQSAIFQPLSNNLCDDPSMSNLSNSTHRARIKPKKHYASAKPKEYTFEGYPVEIIDNFVRSDKWIVVIETQDSERYEVFYEQLEQTTTSR